MNGFRPKLPILTPVVDSIVIFDNVAIFDLVLVTFKVYSLEVLSSAVTVIFITFG